MTQLKKTLSGLIEFPLSGNASPYCLSLVKSWPAPLFKSLGLLACVSILQIIFVQASAAEKHDKKSAVASDAELEPSTLATVESLVDGTHEKVSDRFSQFIVQVDDFIGSGETSEEGNTSWARIRVDTVKPAGEKLKLAATIKSRIVLPQSQQRFRLLVSNADDDSSASNSDAAQREQIASEDNSDVALALRFIQTARKRFRLKYDLGARYKDRKAQLFGRFIFIYKKDGALGFINTFTNSFTLFSASGYRDKFSIDSRRALFDRERFFFKNTVEVSWEEGVKGAAIGETIGIYADLGKRRAIALEGITGYATAPKDSATKRYRGAELRVRYRQNLWRPWFYYEIWPSVSWSSSNDYEKAFGGLFRMEVTLGKI